MITIQLGKQLTRICTFPHVPLKANDDLIVMSVHRPPRAFHQGQYKMSSVWGIREVGVDDLYSVERSKFQNLDIISLVVARLRWKP